MAGFACLACRIPSGVCALPLEHVIEVMRPLPLERLGRPAEFVLGVARIRGLPTPVIDLGRLFGRPCAGEATRFVTLRVADRTVAAAVLGVLGQRTLGPEQLSGVPPLLAERSASVRALGTLDAELLFVLEAARLVPEALEEQLRAGGGS